MDRTSLRSPLLLALLLTGCDGLFGHPDDRQSCSASAECPAGQSCDRGAGLCWPDAAPPTVANLTVTCSTSPCLRDAVLTVEATVADDRELARAWVGLDLDPAAPPVALAPVAAGSAQWRANLPLAAWPLDGLSRTVVATVTARDGARNERAVAAAAGQRPTVTRVRPAIALAGGNVLLPTAPALLADGTVVVGGSDGRLRFVAPGAATATASLASLNAAVTQPVAVGGSALWVAAGSRVFALSLDGSARLNAGGYDTGGAVVGPLAVSRGLAPEVAFAASAVGRMAVVQASAAANGIVNFTGIIDPFTAGPILLDDGTAFAVTGTASPAAATLRRFSYDGALREGVTRWVGSVLTAPLAASAINAIWSGLADVALTFVQETSPSGTAGVNIALASSVGGGAVVLSNGDVALSEGDRVRRFTASGAAVWPSPPQLDGIGLTPIALSGGPEALLVPTRAGSVFALGPDGAILWVAALAPGVELREGTVAATAQATTTAWFTSADGLLHGIVVDGGLDRAAPWPKAWHDPRNTGHRGSAF